MRRYEALAIWVAAAVCLITAMASAKTATKSSSSYTEETVQHVARSGSSHTVVRSAIEAQNVRIKLSAAEERVKSLVSKLDAVSEDAARARMEIHNTLVEAWNIVDLLGKDRCTEAVLQVKKKQQVAESQIADLENRIAERSKLAKRSQGATQRLSSELNELQVTFQSEKEKREQLEVELDDAKGRLKNALSVTNRSDAFSSVQAMLKQIAVKRSERGELLRQISQHLKADMDAENTLESIYLDIKDTVMNHETQLAQTVSSLRMDPAQVAIVEKNYANLETQVKDALKGRDGVLQEAEKLQKHLNALKRVGSSKNGSSSGSFWSTVVIMLISISFGAILVLLGTRSGAGAGSIFKTEGSNDSPRPPAWFDGHGTPGSAGATPHPRGSLEIRSETPGGSPEFQQRSSGDGFYHSDRSPMTYVRSAASPVRRQD
eukprot:Plantae.Rhodophyta-Purpureofilum_apyrenoidigerum.ctg30264.p1 GENE.Plantae.Rhodophyta-Purpureofilum_apyrenoidigerum.ctg30264~~Plantae.Rhodophyta-Purpureofilum_apyrenoidigerum.ctg30264.p1  ORF type:complete len:433 (-),score=89.88 Plantae.Rhodophyta-Purpureofilum_apyrenoidigerum.ctg30264:320-1618(-)